MDLKMWYSEIARMKEEEDRDALFDVLRGSNDQYARRMAAEALCSFCDKEVADELAKRKFSDPDQRVRDVAARGHERIIAALMAKGEL